MEIKIRIKIKNRKLPPKRVTFIRPRRVRLVFRAAAPNVAAWLAGAGLLKAAAERFADASRQPCDAAISCHFAGKNSFLLIDFINLH